MKLRNIAVPIEDTPTAALHVADRLARRDDATVHIFSARDVPAWASAVGGVEGVYAVPLDERTRAQEIAARRRECEALAGEISARTEITVLRGDREDALVEFLSAAEIDLAIMSHAHVGFWSRLFHTGLTGQVARGTEVPVLAIGDVDAAERIAQRGIRKIVVGVGERADARAAAAYCSILAEPSAELHFLHVRDDDDDDEAMSTETLQCIVQEADVFESQKSFVASVEGARLDELLSEARAIQADVVIVGSRQHESLADRFVGTTADRVLRAADRFPVLVIPAERRRHLDEERALDIALSSSMPASDPVQLTPPRTDA